MLPHDRRYLFPPNTVWRGHALLPGSPPWSPVTGLGEKVLLDWDAASFRFTDFLRDSGDVGTHAYLVLGSGTDYASRHIADGPSVLGYTSCVDFNTSGDMGSFTEDVHPYAINTDRSLTISAWVKPVNLSAIRNVLGASAAWDGMDILTDGTFRIVFASGASVASTGAVTANVWSHLAITRSADGSSIKFYLNGVAAGTGSNDTDWTVTRLGASQSGREGGRLSDVRIYADELSAGDVALLAAGGSPSTSPDWHWRLNDGPSDLAQDGETVSRWRSLDADSREAIQTTLANKPTYLARGMCRRPCLVFNGSQLLRYAGTTAAKEAYIVARVTDTPNDEQCLVASSDEASTNRHLQIYARGPTANPYAGISFQNAGSEELVWGDDSILDNDGYLLIARDTGGALTLKLHGSAQTLTGTNNGNFFSNITGADNVTLGAKQDSGGVSNELVGEIYRVILTDELTADERTLLESYLTRQYLSSWDLRMDGDSIVTGTALGDPPYPFPNSWADQLQTAFTPGPASPCNFYNVAEGGTNLTAMTTDPRKALTLAAIDCADAGGRLLVYVCMMGNGLIEFQPTDYYTALKAFATELRAQGNVAVIAAHIWHRNDEINAPGWSTGVDVDAINVYLSEDPSLWDGLLDWENDTAYTGSPHYASLEAAGDETLFPDGIHQSDVVNTAALRYAKQIIGNRVSNSWSTCSVAPAISGTVRVGETLTCSPGTWDLAGEKSYQWYQSGHPHVTTEEGHYFRIDGATSSTYTLTSDSTDHTIKCNVGNTVHGITSWKASAATAEVGAYLAPSLLSNGRFAGAYTGGWSAEAGGLLSGTGDVLTLTQPDPSQNHVRLRSDNFSLVIGEEYRLHVTFTEGTGGDSAIRVVDADNTSLSMVSISLTESGDYYRHFTATNDTAYVEVRDPGNTGANETFIYDNFDVSRIVTDPWEQFTDESFVAATYATTSGASVTGDDLDGPTGGFAADKIVLGSGGYHYKQPSTNWPWISGDGDTVRVLYALKGTAGEKVGVRIGSTGGVDSSTLHTFTGGWDLVEVEHTLGASYTAGYVGFDRRNGVIPGSDSGSSITFWAWGIGWRMS